MCKYMFFLELTCIMALDYLQIVTVPAFASATVMFPIPQGTINRPQTAGKILVVCVQVLCDETSHSIYMTRISLCLFSIRFYLFLYQFFVRNIRNVFLISDTSEMSDNAFSDV